jgi:hypothetical protein
VRGSSLAWPASLDALRPFIVTYWSGRTVADMPDDVYAVVDAAGFRQKHLNLALFALDADGKVLRSSNPQVRPSATRFDPESMGRDFRRQLDDMLDGLPLPKVASADPPKLTLPDVTGDGRPAGVRVFLTFAKNRLNHYRTPTVEAVKWTAAMRDALRYPDERRGVSADGLRPLLEQLYPPAIMDGHGGCRRIDADLTLTPAGSDGATRYAVLKGTVAIELDNANRTRYEGPLALVVTYAADNAAARALRGVGTWDVPKHNPQGQVAETIRMTAAIESRPD